MATRVAPVASRTVSMSSNGNTSARMPSMKKFVGLKAAAFPAGRQGAKATPVAGRTGLVVRAARVGGVDIPNQKRIETALTYIFGIGPTTAKAIMSETNMENKRTRELSEEELTTLRMEVDKYQIEGDLRRFNLMSIKRLKDIQCYRGRRHIAGLPMHGQRTKNNARTRKGKRVAIAGKKK
eukprot:CAMPEP_0118935368 /NCGR_PEP_ID=MMETSP1169-20130426/15537_1 /TAXON_ID=36882 /ORGANISM="Pyramimonas obovata, Strain CCMP722" /LENGTH=180 /DNA_ID=CAMNT_0006878391 /DNA_START=78 /DNA_END=620 /DNA_ORIENTATION=-